MKDPNDYIRAKRKFKSEYRMGAMVEVFDLPAQVVGIKFTADGDELYDLDLVIGTSLREIEAVNVYPESDPS